MKRSLVQLAQTAEINDMIYGGFFMSEKLDGQRALWDGGISRGLHVDNVPWANTEKNSRFVNQDIRATGLWTRYGHPIQAPAWWLDRLPPYPLDGELWMGHQTFQDLMSLTRRLEPDSRGWQDVKYLIFDSPTYEELFILGDINEVHYKKLISPDDLAAVLVANKVRPVVLSARPFGNRLEYLGDVLTSSDTLELHKQEQLPFEPTAARLRVEIELEKILGVGGEGLILRNPHSYWEPRRTKNLLKVKEKRDAEAVVVGYKAGELGKLHGMMGALQVRFNGLIFDLSGFTDAERRLVGGAEKYALASPGKYLPPDLGSELFPRGTYVTFTYRELTNDGLPKEARYLRK